MGRVFTVQVLLLSHLHYSPSTTELAPKVSTDHPTNSPFNTSHRINGGDQVHIGENTNTLAPPDFPVAPAREAATDPPELQLILYVVRYKLYHNHITNWAIQATNGPSKL